MKKREWKIALAWWTTLYQGFYFAACLDDRASSSAWDYARVAAIVATVVVSFGVNLYATWKWATK
jgi:hypothetical protein